MPSTHTSLHYHIVFSTKDRFPLIDESWKDDLHAYLGGIIGTLGGVPVTVGGMPDHVHLLVGLRPVHQLSNVLENVKKSSSSWVHDNLQVRKFSWQPGYGTFTVSPSNVPGVRRYILNQALHHRKKSFQEEYLEFLKIGGVEFDERYLW